MRALLLLAAGCATPLLDEPPYLISLNGVEAGGGPRGRQANTHQNVPISLPPPTSDVLELEVEATDPEGDPFDVWFPSDLGTIEFDPHGTRGRWILPGPDPAGRLPPLPPLNLVLRQPDNVEAATWYLISFDAGADGSTP
jgi:hypothetical protein